MDASQFRKFLKGLDANDEVLEQTKGKSLEEWWEDCSSAKTIRWFLTMARDTPKRANYWVDMEDIIDMREEYDKHGDLYFLKWVRESYEIIDWK